MAILLSSPTEDDILDDVVRIEAGSFHEPENGFPLDTDAVLSHEHCCPLVDTGDRPPVTQLGTDHIQGLDHLRSADVAQQGPTITGLRGCEGCQVKKASPVSLVRRVSQ